MDAKLSPMHVRVIDMVGEGRTFVQIAGVLGCSEGYIRKLARQIRHEFGIHDMKTRDAVVFAYVWREHGNGQARADG